MSKAVEARFRDAFFRIEAAELHYRQLLHELEALSYEHIERTLKTEDNGEFYIGINPPSELIVTGVATVLAAKIAEDLRSALDYSVSALSMANCADYEERLPQFPIADSKEDFDRFAKKRLSYLTDEQVRFIEELQPYQGNVTLRLIRDAANATKHRRLLVLKLLGSSRIDVLGPGMEEQEQYRDWRIFRPHEGVVVAAKVDKQAFQFLEDYDATQALPMMIGGTADVIRSLASHLKGHALPSVKYR